MADAHANFAYSTVTTAPSPATSGTSLIVGSGDGAKFPAVPFNATVWPANTQPTTANAEIIRVTARTTDSFGTIVRAQESSSARSVIVGDQIAATITAKTLTDVEPGGIRNGVPRMVVRTTQSASRASTTTLSDDSVLVFPIAANEVWRIQTHMLFVAANPTMDLKVAFSQPAGCSGNWGAQGAYFTEEPSWSGGPATGSPQGLLNSGTATFATGNGEFGIVLSGIWVNGGTAGNIGFQWAQSVSDAGAITVERGSHMMGWRLE